VHDDHRLHPRLRQKRLDRSISRPFLPRASRSLRFDQTETNSCDYGKRGSNIRDRGQIHLQFLILISKRSAVFEEKRDQVVDRPLRGRSILASSSGLRLIHQKKPQDSHGTLRL
jgi:hypothetical protein